ncbi:uncharacterized protein LOC135165315 [Diachasmimorpha longicaudata]|uniref:uncharacterized protein LOC135165315 n=1 Tax=Diachasmimorpha longicaudata TaxID=58733 RepID=UPI0030B8AEB5
MELKFPKEIFTAIFLLSYVDNSIGLSTLTTLGSSIEEWATHVWDKIKQDTYDHLWEGSVDGLSYSVHSFDRIGKFMLIEFQEINDFENLLKKRVLKGAMVVNECMTQDDVFNTGISKLLKHTDAIDRITQELENALALDFLLSQQLCSWAKSVVDGERMLKEIQLIHRMFSTSKCSILLNLAKLKFMKAASTYTFCGKGYSPYDYIHTIYDLIVSVEKKAHLVGIFSHHLLHVHNGTALQCQYSRSDSTREIKALHSQFLTRIQKYNDLFTNSLKTAVKEFQACDDTMNSFERDVTYFELEGAIQGYLQKNSLGSLVQDIPGTCDLMSGGHDQPKNCDRVTNFCATPLKYPCMGYITGCKDLQPISRQACLTTRRPRRYDFFATATSSPPKFCLYELEDLSSTCLCTCVDNDVNSMSTHLFNLQPVEADTAKNKVVTGIRFIVHKRIMHLQIQQGRLGDDWRIDGPAEWKPINDISEEIRAQRLGVKLRGKPPAVRRGVDYAVVEEGTALNLDLLIAPNGHVLTGVKFELAPTGVVKSQRIQIAILSRPFDALLGQWSRDQTTSIIMSPRDRRRTEFVYPKGKIEEPEMRTKESVKDQFVSITTSNMENDWGQVTLPYFDGKPVASDPPTALGGVKMFYKYGGEFPGFVALKCISLNYGYFMDKFRYSSEKVYQMSGN